jgi:phosphoribosylaminoimidazole-succinocarboxamide synthase
MERYTYELFSWGQEQASRRGLILADTKYEFGLDDKGQLMLIDEVHTPDSSRYFYAEQYEELREKGEKPKQLSKEFVREWLMSEGFQGKEGQEFPEMTDDVIQSIMDRYQELYEKLLGEPFQFPPSDLGPNERIQASIDLHAHSFPAK